MPIPDGFVTEALLESGRQFFDIFPQSPVDGILLSPKGLEKTRTNRAFMQKSARNSHEGEFHAVDVFLDAFLLAGNAAETNENCGVGNIDDCAWSRALLALGAMRFGL